MELSMRELNELIYCIDVARKHGQLLGTTVADTLAVRLRDELDKRLEMELWDNTLLDGLDDLPMDKLKGAAERYSNGVRVKHIHIEEDSFKQLLSKVEKPTKERGWIVQAMLDYVDTMGARTHKQMEEYYKFITNGSNSFSHCLINLKVPYKNRPTQRYLVKEGRRGSNAKWVVKVANPANWVVVND
jgi:hypothetical protein